MTIRLSVRAIILHQDKLLCVRLKDYKGSIKGDFWCLPGGGLDESEDIVAGIEREMIEETGVKPQVGNLLYIHQFQNGTVNNVEFFFHVTNAIDYLHVDPTATTHGNDEIAEIDFIDPAAHYILPKFLSSAPLTAKVTKASPTEIVSQSSSDK